MARVYNRHFAKAERWMKVSEVVEYSGRSRKTIYRYVESGMLKPKYQRRPTGTLVMCFAESEVRKLFEPMTPAQVMFGS